MNLVASSHLCVQLKCIVLCYRSTTILVFGFKTACIKMNEKIVGSQSSPLCFEAVGERSL